MPGWMLEDIPLAFMMSLAETPEYFLAISYKVSPALTV